MKIKTMMLAALMATGTTFTACGDDDDDNKVECPCENETDYQGKMGVLIGGRFDCGQIDASMTVYQDNKLTCNITLHPFELMVEQMRTKVGLLEDLVAENVKLTADEKCGYRFEGTFNKKVSTLFGDSKSQRTLTGTVSGTFGDGKCECTMVFPPATGWEGMPMEMQFTFSGIL